jgi:hypothetical protein
LNAKQRTNASLVFFTLAVTTVVDFLVNNEGSWAYNGRPGLLARTGEDGAPLLGVDSEVDTTAIFDDAVKKREAKAAENGREEQAPAEAASPPKAELAAGQQAPGKPPAPQAGQAVKAPAQAPKPAAPAQTQTKPPVPQAEQAARSAPAGAPQAGQAVKAPAQAPKPATA